MLFLTNFVPITFTNIQTKFRLQKQLETKFFKYHYYYG